MLYQLRPIINFQYPKIGTFGYITAVSLSIPSAFKVIRFPNLFAPAVKYYNLMFFYALPLFQIGLEQVIKSVSIGCDYFGYDADGLGATLRDNVAAAFNGKQTNVYAYKGSTSPHNPESDFKSKVSSIQSSDKTVKNKDALKNKKAQNTMLLADRVYRTYDAVVNGKYHDPETLVSFASYDEETGIGIKPDMLRKLKAEASKIPIKEGNTIRFYTKPEMRRGITLPGGGKMVIPSPNLLDAVIVSLDKDCHIYKQEPIDIASLMVPVANSW